MDKPKVLVLTSSYPKYEGDVNGNFVYELATRLKSDFDIMVLVPAYKGSLKYEVIENIKIFRHKQFFLKNVELAYGSDILAKIRKNLLYLIVVPFYLSYQFLALSRIVKNEKIQIIHAHWLIPQAFMAVLYKVFVNSKVKIIGTAHGADINSFDNFMGRIIKRFVLKRINELTVVSNAIKEKAINLGYKRDVFVYPMGVDTKLFSPEKKDLSIKTKYNINGPFLLFVGGIIERKGIRYLIQAMPDVIEKFADTRLVVVGDGNLRKEMVSLTRELKISNNVIFTGAISHKELPPFFATAELFILPSFSEGFGLVIIEAMSCKTLAVTSNLEVVHDIITENETGLFFEEINKHAISGGIATILENKEKFENIREKGRQQVIEKFDWNIISKNYANLINKLATNN